jgi:acyl carrier protein
MNNLEKYNSVFAEIFSVDSEFLGAAFTSESVDNWDSVLQLSLVTAIEDAFDVMFEAEEIMDFKSYNKGKEILAQYGIEIDYHE